MAVTGRPRKIKTPEEFDALVDQYIARCTAEEEPITWTGMALSLGFANRAAIDEYAKYDGFSYSVKRAKALVENAYEKRLHGNSPTGAIFALKNMGWKDRPEVDDGSDPESIARIIRAAISGIEENTHGSDTALDEA